ncbi:MAG: 30S ribosomal protein S20 [Oscillospiraceae bacterium]|nr:30S ribosomal protein S20 [Oscillospiraceae bacterium]
MPNIKSQKKRVITNAKSNDRNKAIKTNLKTVVKKAEASLAAGTQDAQTVVNNAQSAIDKAVAKGAINKNTASRKKASIAKKATKA